ncbi:MAG: nucleotidyltransferase family protein [Nostoc sp. ChiSLP02]|nr:nucleotidyltransferase family protein [Nostoc sp. DedSLP05]MDZ8099606.1 nucleotidyltransferase family protein [Nostoc sp. DedSLP01]MDZ8188159.1 nucleotidyltransferase family protein [Nostoc sp. ChiSLP02]
MKSEKKPNLDLPTPQQKLLLQASLLHGQNALNAWQSWSEIVDIEKLDSESYNLLCLLYRNLSVHKIQHSKITIIKGIYRRTWYANQLLFSKIQPILQTFYETGIKILMLADIALISNYYQDYGHRPVYAIDLFIPSLDIDKAIKLLANLGWKKVTSEKLDFELQDEFPQLLFIPRGIFWAEPQEKTDNQLWNYAISCKISNISTLALSHTDQLLYICLRAFPTNQLQEIRWLADAMIILQAYGNEIDWSRLVTQAQRYQLVLPLKNMLTILEEIFNFLIPNWVLASLNKTPNCP